MQQESSIMLTNINGGGIKKDIALKRVAVATLGCKVNSYESELIFERLIKDGYTRVDTNQEADLYIINSCTVTAEADRQSRQIARKLKRINPNAKLVMTGCFAQNNAEAGEQMPEVDLVVGNAAKLDIPVIINHAGADTKKQNELNPTIVRPEFGELITRPDDLLTGYENQSRAFIQIQQGCNQGCTFCIIHSARGPSQSFPVQAVIEQYQKMVESGYKEVVICGVDLGSYGEDLQQKTDLSDVLKQMLELQLDCRLRLSSIDPIHITDSVIELYKNYPSLCPHVHLSMQSASTLILKRMKRRASREQIYQCVEALRAARPDLVLSADVLIGFPTEQIDHFNDSIRAISDLKIAYPHVFPYSIREGTPAAKIPKQVQNDEKKRRAKLAREMGTKIWNEVAQTLVGSEVLAIIESKNKQGDLIARRADYFPVEIPNTSHAMGQWAKVQISHLDGQRLIGKILT